MFEVANLSVNYGKKNIIHDLNFKLSNEDILAVIGPSGAGKTTLINAITKIIPSNGEIILNDKPVNLQTDTIAMVPQNYGLLPWKTVEQNIVLANQIRQHKKLDEQQKLAISDIMIKLEIDSLKNQFPDEISGGQQQRVALARAFSLRPDLLILDEAFSALDTVVKQKAQELFITEWRESPVTTLLITHNLEEALNLSTKILILHNGSGSMRENPMNDVALLDRTQNPRYYQVLKDLQEEVDKLWQQK